MSLPVLKKGSGKKRVVFVKMDGIGDYVIWTAFFANIRMQYPFDEYERVLIGNDKFQGLAENEPTFDERIYVNPENFVTSPTYRFRVMRQVRELAGNIIINARSTRDFLWSDSIIRCSAAEEKIGSEDIGSMAAAGDLKLIRRWYTSIRSAAKPGDHELIWHSAFLGIPIDKLSLAGSLDAILVDKPLVEGDYAIFFIGAQSGEKCWPASYFGEAAAYVASEYGLRVVLCGGSDAGYLADGFKECFKGEIIEYIGPSAASLPEVVNLIRSATIVVANDTGAAHISVFTGGPTVVVAPGNQSGRYFPYPVTAMNAGVDRLKVLQRKELCVGCSEDCKFTKIGPASVRPCLSAISVGDVIDALDALYAGS